MANVLDKLPKRLHPAAKRSLTEMMYADSRASFDKELARFVEEYKAKYPKAVEALVENKAELTTFFDLPADHWKHLRTTNPIESTFATVKLRSRVTKGAGSRAAGLTMTYKLLRAAEATWRRLDAQELLSLVRAGVRFIDGKQPERDDEEVKLEDTKKAGKVAA